MLFLFDFFFFFCTALKHRRRRRKQNEQDEQQKTKNLNQQTTVSDEKSNHEELSVVHNVHDENNQQQNKPDDDDDDEIIQLDQDADNVVEEKQNRITSNKHDTNESMKQQQTFHCWPSRSSSAYINHEQTNQPKNLASTLSSLSFSLSSLLESVSTKENQTIIDSVEPTTLETMLIIIMKPIIECLAIIKRCLNRSMRNGSHYGAYNLSTTNTHDNFSVNSDDDDYNEGGQQIEVFSKDNHKWRNQNKRTLTDYRNEQKNRQQEVSLGSE